MALLAGCVSACSLALAVELLIRLVERIGIMDRMLCLFGLAEQENNVIYVDFEKRKEVKQKWIEI